MLFIQCVAISGSAGGDRFLLASKFQENVPRSKLNQNHVAIITTSGV